MKRLLIGLLLTLVACGAEEAAGPSLSTVDAACSGSGLVWSCPAGSTSADISAVIASATNGATLTFAAGSYTITAFTKVSSLRGITFICATAPLANGAATVNPCLMNLTTGWFGSDTFGGQTYTNCYRFSGFLFDMGGSTVSSFGAPIFFDNANGTAGTTTMTCIRVDHNTFQNMATDQPLGVRLGHAGVPYNPGHWYGVIDHNTFLNGTSALALYNEGGAIDMNFTTPSAQAGTANNMFFEDNILNMTTSSGSGQGCTDGWGGMAVVIRFNTSTNCRYTNHGEKHEGGPNNIEVYGNSITLNAGASNSQAFFQDCTWCVQHQGSGEYTIFNNSFFSVFGKSGAVIETQDYRAGDDASSLATFYSPDLGTHLPQCTGNASTGTAINFPFGTGTINDGNRTPETTYRGYPCWHQVGRDRQQVLKPVYTWNNYWSDTLAIAPFHVHSVAPVTFNYTLQHIAQNRDWYTAVSASAQTSTTNPFNGTTGMGFGTFVNRPTTCTPTPEAADAGNGGVGYWATDQGSWKSAVPSQGVWTAGQQGVLYTCSATNTWSVHYTPYTYPHPLASGAPPDTMPPAAPTGVMISSVQESHE
jgi:hypothetical protein